MADYRIITDSSCDLTALEIQELNIPVVSLSLNIQGKSICPTEEDYKSIYAALRAGENATTSAANPDDWMGAMEPVLKEGQDLLVMAFSSGLSTTYQSSCIAADGLREEFPDAAILTVDTLCASMGQGLLVYLCALQKQAGKSIEEVRDYAEATKMQICHWVTVDDLNHLKRGGRVSAATALFGSMLTIKPIIHVDDEGHLINVGKARGRKPSLMTLAAEMEKRAADPAEQTVFISHGDCLEDAQLLEKILQEKYGVKSAFIYYVGAVIGSHSGPGTLALFFMGNKR